MTAIDYEKGRLAVKKQYVKDGINVSEELIKSYCRDGGYDESKSARR